MVNDFVFETFPVGLTAVAAMFALMSEYFSVVPVVPVVATYMPSNGLPTP